MRITSHQPDFRQSTIEVLDPNHALPVAKPFYLDVHWSFVLSEN